MARFFFALLRIISEEDLHPFQITFLFTLFSLFFVSIWVLKSKDGISSLKTKKTPLFALRGILELSGFLLSMYSIKFIPLPAFSALGFINPILTAILAIFLLREKSDRHDWIALFGGFIGVMIIIRPSGEGLEFEAIYRVLSMVFFAFCGIVIKKLTKTESVIKIVFYDIIFFTIFSAPLAFIYWKEVSLSNWGILGTIGLLAFLMQILISKAFHKADVTKLMPFYFVELVFSSVIAYFVFDEIITVWTAIGAVIIMKSVIYCGYKSKQNKTPPSPII